MGLGDALMINGIIHNLKCCNPQSKVVVLYDSDRPTNVKGESELFRGNPEIVLFTSIKIWRYIRWIFFPFSVQVLQLYKNFMYFIYDNDKDKVLYPKDDHIILQGCEELGINCQHMKPLVFITEKERNRAASLLSRKNLEECQYFCIEPNIKVSFSTTNKAWFWDRWQELIKRLNEEFASHSPRMQLVQLGAPGSKKLEATFDLRGTLTFKETGEVLRRSAGLVTTEGGLMHLATSVGIRSVILNSGYHPKWLSCYPDDIVLYSDLECKACGLRVPCPNERECMKRITVDDVYKSILLLLKQAGPNTG